MSILIVLICVFFKKNALFLELFTLFPFWTAKEGTILFSSTSFNFFRFSHRPWGIGYIGGTHGQTPDAGVE
jgi:hypothetical protein